jgi:hypothetical protein
VPPRVPTTLSSVTPISVLPLNRSVVMATGAPSSAAITCRIGPTSHRVNPGLVVLRSKSRGRITAVLVI